MGGMLSWFVWALVLVLLGSGGGRGGRETNASERLLSGFFGLGNGVGMGRDVLAALMGQIIVENERDRRTLQWLIGTVGQDAILDAIQRIPGNRRPYVSNVAKVLGLTPPKDLEIADRETARRYLEAIRKQLERLSSQAKTD